MPRPLGAPLALKRTKGPKGSNRWELLYTDEGLMVIVTMREVFGRHEIVGLELKPFDGPPELEIAFPQFVPIPITTELLRRLPLSKLKAACLADLATGLGNRVGSRDSTFLKAVGEVPQRGQQPVPIAKLEMAASVYQQALRRMENPIKQIEVEMGIKPATARKYVARARNLGLLGYPEEPGIAGTSSATSPITGRRSDAHPEEDQP
jgi:hypothetical protein